MSGAALQRDCWSRKSRFQGGLLGCTGVTAPTAETPWNLTCWFTSLCQYLAVSFLLWVRFASRNDWGHQFCVQPVHRTKHAYVVIWLWSHIRHCCLLCWMSSSSTQLSLSVSLMARGGYSCSCREPVWDGVSQHGMHLSWQATGSTFCWKQKRLQKETLWSLGREPQAQWLEESGQLACWGEKHWKHMLV